ncbi:hypothetical protein CRE_05126 [Caenorhabditis remanei]|uniref:DNA2/NAM7 helicase-like C-terminal domain-containing protein n=1 Tax=Caenorhabditis remanei TaxID=31234 RepID=E3N6C2_CAERE|nr:hypothetical protein CRE_05126 [Caenorhabditis remanei]
MSIRFSILCKGYRNPLGIPRSHRTLYPVTHHRHPIRILPGLCPGHQTDQAVCRHRSERGPQSPRSRKPVGRNIEGLMPAEHLRSRRCPFEVTSSAMFYQNRLTSIRSPRERSRFLDLVAFNNGYPLQIIDTTRFAAQQTSGTSLFNPTEASIALAITSRVLAREEKTELDDTPAFVGTIDASQGQEFDLVIIFTSRSKSFHSSDRAGERNTTPDGTATADPDFIESPERLNVAITRTKSLCLVLVDVAAAGRSKLWSNLFCKIPPGAFHNNPSHLMRHLQTLH